MVNADELRGKRIEGRRHFTNHDSQLTIHNSLLTSHHPPSTITLAFPLVPGEGIFDQADQLLRYVIEIDNMIHAASLNRCLWHSKDDT
jgi:hypothetical protein